MPDTPTAQVYAFIQATLRQQGYPPSFDEIGRACHLGHDAVLARLGQLEKAGRLHFRPDRPRSLRLVDES